MLVVVACEGGAGLAADWDGAAAGGSEGVLSVGEGLAVPSSAGLNPLDAEETSVLLDSPEQPLDATRAMATRSGITCRFEKTELRKNELGWDAVTLDSSTIKNRGSAVA